MRRKYRACILFSIIFVMWSMAAQAASKDPYDGFSTTLLDGSNITTYNISGGFLGSTGAGNYFYYENLNFGTVSPTSVELEIGVPEEYAGSVVELRIDSPTGPVIASITDKASSFDTALVHSAPIITPVTGVHTLYIKTGSNTANFFNIKFNQPLTGQDVYMEYEDSDPFLDIRDNSFRNSINTLYQLGFIDGEGTDYFYPDLFVKRKDFAQMALKILNQELGKDKTKQYFEDVTSDMEAYGAINLLYEMGIISGGEHAKFHPDDFITKTDAMVILCNLLGYKNMAELGGGYPQGYISIASGQRLYDGLEKGENLRSGELARLLCNVFDAYYLELDSVSGATGPVYKEVKGILSKTMDIYKGAGLVAATEDTALTSSGSDFSLPYVEIDGMQYEPGDTPGKSLLGYECDFYYKSKNNKEERVLMAIMPRNGVEVTTATSQDCEIYELTTEQVRYEDAQGKQRRISLKKDTSILYNGVAIDAPLEELLGALPLRGKIKYIKNPKAHDVLFIDEYINIRIGMVDKENQEILDDLTDTLYKLENYSFFCTKGGDPVSFSRLKVKDVGMFYVSKNKTGKKLARLTVSGGTVNGSIEQIMESSTKIKLNGTIYKVSPEFRDFMLRGMAEGTSFEDRITVGMAGLYDVNAYREVVAYEAVLADSDRIGYLLDFYYDIEDELIPGIAKILTTDNTVEKYQFAANTIIDGERVTNRSARNLALKLDSMTDALQKPARYQLNDKSQITLLDTVQQGTGDSKDKFAVLMPSAAYNYGHGTRLLINSGTGKGVYPFAMDGWLLSKWENTDSEHATFSRGGFMESGNSGVMYTLDPKRNTCDVFVWDNRGRDNNTSFVLDQVMTAIDKNEENGYILGGYFNDQYAEYIITGETLSRNPDIVVVAEHARRGDCFQVTVNDKNEVTAVQLMYLHDNKRALSGTVNGEIIKLEAKIYADYDESGTWKENYAYSDGGQKYRAVFGEVLENTGDYIKIDLGSASSNDVEYIYTKSNNLVKSENKRLEDGQSNGSIMKGDRIYAYIADRNTKIIVIYR